MARKKTKDSTIIEPDRIAPIQIQSITDVLEKNYMPYAMSVIISRAIPEIDGFKPSHRKLLYTMYTMGLLKGNRTKSANIVGQTMKLNPHGDASIYETMVRLTRGHEALLHPFIDSKGIIQNIYDMTPYSESNWSSTTFVKYALEVPQGWFDQTGVKVGDKVLLPNKF